MTVSGGSDIDNAEAAVAIMKAYKATQLAKTKVRAGTNAYEYLRVAAENLIKAGEAAVR